MEKLHLTYVGEDYWSRPVYQDAKGNFYKDVEMCPEGVTPKELYLSCPSKDFEGEPGWPLTDFVIV